MSEELCRLPHCDRSRHALGFCKTHYERSRTGLPLIPIARKVPKVCIFLGCGRRMTSRGLCASHAWQRKQGHDLTPIVKIFASECTEPGCARAPQTRGRFAGLCSGHARHMREWGTTRPIRDRFPLRDPIKFWTAVEKRDTGCWEWQGSMSSAGYGTLNLGEGLYGYAHRHAWELMRGQIPSGLDVDHLCRNRACVNPGHLEPVSHAENVRRGAAGYGGVRTTCKHGHDITLPENVYTTPRGHRRCRPCGRDQEKARRKTLDSQ